MCVCEGRGPDRPFGSEASLRVCSVLLKDGCRPVGLEVAAFDCLGRGRWAGPDTVMVAGLAELKGIGPPSASPIPRQLYELLFRGRRGHGGTMTLSAPPGSALRASVR